MNTALVSPEIRAVEFMGDAALFIYLNDERTFIVPLNQFPTIRNLTLEQRMDFEVIDGIYLSFQSIDDIYSINQLIGIG